MVGRAVINKQINGWELARLQHDFMKPIGAISCCISLLESAKDFEEFRMRLDMFKSDMNLSIGALKRTVRSSLKKEDLLEQTTYSDFREISLETMDLAQKIHQKKVEFDLSINHSKPIIFASEKLQRVLQNLFLNAFEAWPKDFAGKVWLVTKKLGNKVEIKVGNSGSHISKENLDNIFLDSYSEGKKEGSGLGLSIVKSFVEKAGGSVSVSSEKSQVEFKIILPIAECNI